MAALPKIPVRMTVAEFLAWNPPSTQLWQLVDGEPQAMAPANRTHGAIQSELGSLIRNHLVERSSPCSVVTTPGVIPRVQSETNLRIPDLAVSAELLRRNQDGSWPNRPLSITTDDLTLESIGFHIPLAAAYRTTRLAV